MLLRPLCLGAACLLLPPASAAGQATVFAVAVGGGAVVLPVTYQEGRVRPEVVTPTAFRSGMLHGLTMEGTQVYATVDSIIHDPGEGDPDFAVTIRGLVRPDPSAALADSVYRLQLLMAPTAGTPVSSDSARASHLHAQYDSVQSKWLASYARVGQPDAVLLWHGPVKVVPVSSITRPLDARESAQLRPIADSLWSSALDDLEPDDRPRGYRLGYSFVMEPAERHGTRLVWMQVISGQNDPRGSFFFLLRGSRVVRAGFGHPEWSPNSRIMQARPYILLRVGADKRLFALCSYTSAWESPDSWALIDTDTGNVLPAP